MRRGGVSSFRGKEGSERVRSLAKTLLGRRLGDVESLVPIGPAVLERIAKIQTDKQLRKYIFKL